MKRIAIFLGGYLPAKKYGGPVTSVANLVENLGDEFSFYIISNDHDLDETKRLDGIQEGWNSVGKAQVLYIPEKEYGYKRFSSILKEINADAVYLSSIFYYSMNLPAIRAAKKQRIPVILAPRGELCENAFRLGKAKKLAYISLVKLTHILDKAYFHATSSEEESGIRKYVGAPKGHVFLMPNMHGAFREYEKPPKYEGELKLLFLARIHEKKNLLGAIRAIAKAQGNIQFDIYGPIEQAEYWEKCKQEIREVDERIKIEYKGALAPDEAKSVFAGYHCFLFPTYSENYGHVIAEALLCRCPVIISKGTTPWDDVDGVAGFTAKLGDEDQFAECINKLTQMNQGQYDFFLELLDRFLKKRLNTDELKSQYREMFECVMNNRK